MKKCITINKSIHVNNVADDNVKTSNANEINIYDITFNFRAINLSHQLERFQKLKLCLFYQMCENFSDFVRSDFARVFLIFDYYQFRT